MAVIGRDHCTCIFVRFWKLTFANSEKIDYAKCRYFVQDGASFPSYDMNRQIMMPTERGSAKVHVSKINRIRTLKERISTFRGGGSRFSSSKSHFVDRYSASNRNYRFDCSSRRSTQSNIKYRRSILSEDQTPLRMRGGDAGHHSTGEFLLLISLTLSTDGSTSKAKTKHNRRTWAEMVTRYSTRSRYKLVVGTYRVIIR